MNFDLPDRPGRRSGPIKSAAAWWAAAVSRLGVGRLWLIIWLAALAVPFLPIPALSVLTVLAWLSVAALAPSRHRAYRLVLASLLFLCFWGLLTVLIHLLQPTSLRPILNLAAWLALGLNLILARTPLALALAAGRFLEPGLGRLGSRKLALALALLARLIPGLLASALKIRSAVNYRAAGLPLTRRLILLGRSVIRDTLSQANDLSRALLKRWPW